MIGLTTKSNYTKKKKNTEEQHNYERGKQFHFHFFISFHFLLLVLIFHLGIDKLKCKISRLTKYTWIVY